MMMATGDPYPTQQLVSNLDYAQYRGAMASNYENIPSFHSSHADDISDVKDEVRVVNSATGGEKGQKGARFDLLPWPQLREVAELYGKGAEKYEARNWERGYDWSLSFAALHRHLESFWSGEYLDEENGLPHLTSVVFHALALMHFHENHPELDDRPIG